MEAVHRISLSLIAATALVGIAESVYEEVNRRGLFPPTTMRIGAVVLAVSMAIYILTRKRNPKANPAASDPPSDAP
jgi:hypothetical protein